MTPIIEGTGRVLDIAGVPGAGTDEVQTLTIGGTPTGGTFTISFDGHLTAPIAWNATNGTLIANIDAALEALANIGTGGVTTAVGSMTAGIGTATLTFAGTNTAKRALPLAVANGALLTGTAPTVAIAETTPGVTAFGIGQGKGALARDTTNGKLYINTGTAAAPVWAVVGTQT